MSVGRLLQMIVSFVAATSALFLVGRAASTWSATSLVVGSALLFLVALVETIMRWRYELVFRLSDLLPRWYSSCPAARGRRWRRDADEELERGRIHLSEAVLWVQRTYCTSRAVLLENSPELLPLSAVAGTALWAQRRWELDDQEVIFDQTADTRRAAVIGSGSVALLAVVLLAMLWILVPDLLRLGLAAFAALYEGSWNPLAATWHWRQAVKTSGLPTVDLYVGLLCLGIILCAVLRYLVTRAAAGFDAIRSWQAGMTAVVRSRLLDRYSRAINAASPPVLQLRTAPGLAAATADQLVERPETTQLRGLAFDLGAGAIAVSGSRGVGKSTLLSVITASDMNPLSGTTLGVMVAAPVQYNTREFLLHLYAQLCSALITRVGGKPPDTLVRRVGRALRRLLAIVLRIFAAGFVVAVFFPGTRELVVAELSLPRLSTSFVLIGAALGILSLWVDSPALSGDLRLSAEAGRNLQQIRFLQTISHEQQSGLGRSGLQVGWRRARQLAEQPHSLPDIVESYRQFAAEVARWWRTETNGKGKLLIGIDEVDRISDPDLAERFVNEIKAIFGVPHCVYVVSVSEEALANFERRVVRMRTVFDSAFDHVIRLRPLALVDSVNLLRHRLPGVPDRFYILCHCLAGGMPRDVLRVARMMFDVHRESEGSSLLRDLATRLVEIEVQAVKRGFQHQVAMSDPPDPELSALLADPVWPGRSGAALHSAAERLESELGTSGPATALAAALLYYSTVLDIVVHRAEVVDDWVAALRPGGTLTENADLPTGPEPEEPAKPERLVDALTRAHRSLPSDAAGAIRQLRTVREILNRTHPEQPTAAS